MPTNTSRPAMPMGCIFDAPLLVVLEEEPALAVVVAALVVVDLSRQEI